MAKFYRDLSSDKIVKTVYRQSPIKIKATKYGLEKLMIGQSLFCPYDYPNDPEPYPVRMSANALNRKYGELFVLYKHNDSILILEVARIA